MSQLPSIQPQVCNQATMSSPRLTLDEVHGALMSLLPGLRRLYDAILEATLSGHTKDRLAIETAIQNLNEQHENYRNKYNRCCATVNQLLRQEVSDNNAARFEMAMVFRAVALKRLNELVMITNFKEKLSSILTNSIDSVNEADTLFDAIRLLLTQQRENGQRATTTNAATINPHQAQLRGNAQLATTTYAATVNPHQAQLRGNAQGGITINAATINPHQAQMRGTEHRSTESDTPRRDEADLDRNRPEPNQRKRKKDCSDQR